MMCWPWHLSFGILFLSLYIFLLTLFRDLVRKMDEMKISFQAGPASLKYKNLNYLDVAWLTSRRSYMHNPCMACIIQSFAFAFIMKYIL